MMTPKAIATSIKTAVDEFGSLRKAIADAKHVNSAYETHRATLKHQCDDLHQKKLGLTESIEHLESSKKERIGTLCDLAGLIERGQRQYELFESFVAMVEGASSTTQSIEGLIEMFQWLLESERDKLLEPHQLRDIFVNSVLGGLLGCFRCPNCDSHFALAKGARSKFYRTSLCCPVCHNSSLSSDDSYIRAFLNG